MVEHERWKVERARARENEEAGREKKIEAATESNSETET